MSVHKRVSRSLKNIIRGLPTVYICKKEHPNTFRKYKRDSVTQFVCNGKIAR